jgi:tellurite resistance protein TehA-like permease
MATGIVAIAGNETGQRVLGWIMCGTNLLAGAIMYGSGLVRLTREPGPVWRELRHHESGPAFLSIVAGTAVLGSDAAAFGRSARLSLALFSVAVLSWLFITYCFLAPVTEGRNKPSLEKGLSGSWLLIVVATAVLAVLGSDLLRDLGRPQALVPLSAWKHLVRMLPFRYSPGLWSVVFPLGTYSAATLHFSAVYGSRSWCRPRGRCSGWRCLSGRCR